jgi:cephalosporin hydroxylase
MNLWQDFKSVKGGTCYKWTHYFPIYEKHFAQWRNKTLTIFEIGVSNGGSVDLWNRYFGNMATIVGVDINPHCKQFERDNIHIRIGSQNDAGFLDSLLKEFGKPDIVIDDGSHVMSDVIHTFNFMYPHVSKNGIYLVEDLHTAYWQEYGGGLEKKDTFINYSKNFIDSLNADHSRGAVTPDFITNSTLGISYYDSMVVFEKGKPHMKVPVFSG